MSKVGVGKVAVFFVLLVMTYHKGAGQALHIDTKQIEPLIREWNYANNSRSVESFQNVYSAQLLFYAETLSESKAIGLKQELFKLKPWFRQKITTAPTYTPYTSGLIKVDFTKDVLEKSGWNRYRSYLLVSFEDNRYSIVGESDYDTDEALKYQLNIGEPMELETSADEYNVPGVDTTFAENSSSRGADLEAILKSVRAGDLSVVLAPFTSSEVVAVPKGHVFTLVGMLILGGLMIFIADSVHRPRSKKKRTVVYGTTLERADESDHVIQDFKMQSVFEAFVITLFDPLYFRHRRPRPEKVLAGSRSEGETVPDLEFDFNKNETRVTFAIKCVYYKRAMVNELQLFSAERQQAFRRFEEERNMDLYYIIGMGGRPDDPRELYLVPARAIRSEYITKAALKPYGKSGMFFYNRAAQKLQ